MLIINGVDWLDERMLGLKCWFSMDDYECPISSSLVRVDKLNNSYVFRDEYNYELWTYCRLAQGEKIAYDGKGISPVPEGVMVNALSNSAGITTGYASLASQNIDWTQVKEYQVMESEPLELTPQEDKALTAAHNASLVAKGIPTATIARVVEALEAAKDSYSDRLSLYEAGSNPAKWLGDDIAEIDSLLEELEL